MVSIGKGMSPGIEGIAPERRRLKVSRPAPRPLASGPVALLRISDQRHLKYLPVSALVGDASSARRGGSLPGSTLSTRAKTISSPAPSVLPIGPGRRCPRPPIRRATAEPEPIGPAERKRRARASGRPTACGGMPGGPKPPESRPSCSPQGATPISHRRAPPAGTCGRWAIVTLDSEVPSGRLARGSRATQPRPSRSRLRNAYGRAARFVHNSARTALRCG